MFTAYFIIDDDGSLMQVGAVALVLKTVFSNMKLQATAKAYYDEFTLDGVTEYGVKVTMSGVSEETWKGFLATTTDHCRETYGWVEVVIT